MKYFACTSTALFLIIFFFSGCSNIIHRPVSWHEAKSRQATALKYLPKAKKGYVDWVAAVTQNVINPKTAIYTNKVDVEPLDLDIVFKTMDEYPIPDVVFPHKAHTIWLACSNCHPSIFRMKAGGNPVTMEGILKGRFCGRCHGKVAFVLSDCFRCHSKSKRTS